MSKTRFRTALATLSAVGALSLSACAGMSTRDRNTAIGAAVGGVVGSALTGTTAGTIGGAVIGGVIGNQTSRH